MNVYMGIDIGTSNVKALLIDEKGNVVKSMSLPLKLLSPNPAWAEQNPFDWWNAVETLLNQVPKDMKILRIGLSGQMHTLVATDDAGKVLRNAILWCDQRTAAECEDATRKLGGESKVIEMTGNPIYPGFTMPKILWMRNNEPRIYEKIRTCFIAKDYIGWRLTGEKSSEVSDDSGSACYDVSARKWRSDLLRTLDIPEEWLPPVKASQDIRGTWNGIEVVGGGADNAVSALGLGVCEPGDCMISIGTSGTVLAATEKTKPDMTGRLHFFNHVLPNQSYYMGCMLSAAASLNWFKEKMKDASWGDIEKSVKDTPIGANGMLFLPYLNGERTPHRNSNARGVLYGFSAMSEAKHIYRGVMEGITYGLRDSFELIKEMTDVKRVLVVGGGAKNAEWCKMLASNVAMPVSVPLVDEGGAYGAAMLAAMKDIPFSEIKGWVKVKTTVEPDMSEYHAYSNVYSQFKELYKDLKMRFDATV